MVHAIHLCVVETLYSTKDFVCYDTNSETEEDDDDLNIKIDKTLELKSNIKSVINQLRVVVKMFNKSSEKQKLLQSYVIDQEKHELRLIHDVKHRWNSLTKMITQFLKISKCVNHALIDLGKTPFSESEILTLTELNNLLKPLEIALKEL